MSATAACLIWMRENSYSIRTWPWERICEQHEHTGGLRDGARVVLATAGMKLSSFQKKGRTEEGRKKVFISNYWAKSAKSFLWFNLFSNYWAKNSKSFIWFSFFVIFEFSGYLCKIYSLPRCHAFLYVFLSSGLFHLSFIYLCSF